MKLWHAAGHSRFVRDKFIRCLGCPASQPCIWPKVTNVDHWMFCPSAGRVPWNLSYMLCFRDFRISALDLGWSSAAYVCLFNVLGKRMVAVGFHGNEQLSRTISEHRFCYCHAWSFGSAHKWLWVQNTVFMCCRILSLNYLPKFICPHKYWFLQKPCFPGINLHL